MDELSKSVIEAQNGNRESFDKLYSLTQQEVWFTCISLLKNEENAKDTMQNTYLTAFLKLSTIDDPNKFTVWIKKIAVNKCKDFLKAKYTVQVDEEMLEKYSETDELTLPEEYVANHENRKIILKLMEDTLSDVQYQAIFMYYFDEMSILEIAEVMDCPEGTVMSRLNLARTKMKKAITEYEEKNNDKLHAVAFIPFFSSVFNTESKNLSVPKINIDIPHTQAQSIKSTTSSGGKGMFKSTMSKVIASVCAVAVVGGATAAVIIANSGSKQIASEVSSNNSVPTTSISEGDFDSQKLEESLIGVDEVDYYLPQTVIFENDQCKLTVESCRAFRDYLQGDILPHL